jgi:hypothetical protein
VATHLKIIKNSTQRALKNSTFLVSILSMKQESSCRMYAKKVLQDFSKQQKGFNLQTKEEERDREGPI